MTFEIDQLRRDDGEAKLRRLSHTLLRPFSQTPPVEGLVDEYNLEDIKLPLRYRPDTLRIARFGDGGAIAFLGSDYDRASPYVHHHLFVARPSTDVPDVRYTRRDFDTQRELDSSPAYRNVDAMELVGKPKFDSALTQAALLADYIEKGLHLPVKEVNEAAFEKVRSGSES